ncbi:MAG: hypothetical protein H6738_16185 [Alphaproteobacteria bacterium]|nr:hypothetical protein [Alphaproteobacteria bacterium]MCB9698319.1 hypothetical protein [Alphaproteobacteria bacterium]
MAESRLAGLAGRMKALIEAEEKRRDAEAAEQERAAAARRALDAKLEKRKAAGRAARAAMLADVESFCATIGHLRALREGDGAVRLEYRGRTVVLEPDGDDDRIAIRLDDEVVPRNHHMARDGEDWEVVFDHGTSTVRFGLEDGLTQILREHLWVPLPKGHIEVEDVVTAAPAPAPEPPPAPTPVAEAASVVEAAPAPEPPAAEPAAAPAAPSSAKGRRSSKKEPPGSAVKELKGPLG